jgi:hypothetical protein
MKIHYQCLLIFLHYIFFYMTHDEVLVSLLVCFCYVVKKEINKLKARE